MRTLRWLLLFSLSTLAAAQFTTVSGTVTDPNGLPYANGTITAKLVLAGTTPTINGGSFTMTGSAGLNGAGSFIMRLADSLVMTPTANWSFTVCSAGGTIQPSGGTGPQCFTPAPITITGASQSITVQLNAAALALSSAPIVSNNTYARLDGTNQPFTGNVTPSGTGVLNFGALTNRWNGFFATVDASGAANLAGGTTTTTLGATGAANLSGGISTTSLTATGAANLSGGTSTTSLTATGAANLSGGTTTTSLSATGAANLSGGTTTTTLGATGAVTLSGGGTLSGTFTFPSTSTFNRFAMSGPSSSCSATGIGATGSCNVLAGSTDSAGVMLLLANGAGPASSGTATVTFNSSFGTTNNASCVGVLSNGSGSWNARASLIESNRALTAVTFAWDNNAVAVGAGQSYGISYWCHGQ
jgi:hypothetical protein